MARHQADFLSKIFAIRSALGHFGCGRIGIPPANGILQQEIELILAMPLEHVVHDLAAKDRARTTASGPRRTAEPYLWLAKPCHIREPVAPLAMLELHE